MIGGSVVPAGLRELLRDGQWKVLFAITFGWSLSIGIRTIYPVLLPYVRQAYEIDLSTAGILFTCLFAAYGLAQLPGGMLSDRLGGGTVMVASMLISAAMITLVVVADSVAVLFAATFLVGLGTGLFGVARFTSLAEMYPERVGSSIGLVSAGGDLTQSVFPAITGVLAAAFAWQLGFGFTIPLFLAGALGLWLAAPRRFSERSSTTDTPTVGAAKRVLAELWKPGIRRATLVLVVGAAVYQAFIGFYPTYVIEQKGTSSTVAGLLMGLFFALGIAIKPIAGASYDRLGVRWSLAPVLGLTGLGLGLLTQFDTTPSLVVATALISSLLGFGTISQTYVLDHLPESIRGSGLGTIRSGYWTASSASPLLFGPVLDRGYFDAGFAGLAALMLFVAVVSSRLPEPG